MLYRRTCSWSISAAPGLVVALSFFAFSTQPGRDVLSVIDGSDGRFLANLSGTVLPSPIYSNDAAMRITFTSDASVQLGGVKASVSTVVPFSEGQCNTLPSPAVVLVSDTAPVLVQTNPSTTNTTYRRGASCTWVFQAVQNTTQRLCLNIASCVLSSSDLLAIYQGNAGGPDTLLASFTGVSAASNVCSNNAYMRILFTSGTNRQQVYVLVCRTV